VPREKTSSERRDTSARLLPSMLVAARRRADMLQKEMALGAGLDQSYVCALERGRRKVPRGAVVDALCRGMKLEAGERRELMWAAAHDRVLAALSDEGLASHAALVSAALRAAHYLGDTELAGLERQILTSVRSKQHLLALEAEALRGVAVKETAMT
jgi:hypothetical protein